MEDWATVALVLGSNAIMGLVNWLTTRMQINNSKEEIEKRLQAERDDFKHRQRWDSRSQILIKMREEIACMAEKYEAMLSAATQYIEGISVGTKKVIEEHSDSMFERVKKAVQAWNEYNGSGKFEQAVNMQYDSKLKNGAEMIYYDYVGAYRGLFLIMFDKKGDKKKMDEANEVLGRNNKRILEAQSRINELLEQL